MQARAAGEQVVLDPAAIVAGHLAREIGAELLLRQALRALAPAVQWLNYIVGFPDQQALGMDQIAFGHDDARRAGVAIQKISAFRGVGERDNLKPRIEVKHQGA